MIAGLLDCLEQRFPGSQARCLYNWLPLSGSCWARHAAQRGGSTRLNLEYCDVLETITICLKICCVGQFKILQKVHFKCASKVMTACSVTMRPCTLHRYTREENLHSAQCLGRSCWVSAMGRGA